MALPLLASPWMGVSLSRGVDYVFRDLEFADIIFMTLSLLHSALIVSSSLPSIVRVHALCSSLLQSSRRLGLAVALLDGLGGLENENYIGV
ncbi:hypothetical protein BDR03DRAFT_973223 [Suillus americanus]|nr:hypothetical protein BDR03DRAFT_973223 [Suillus americanus]